MHAIYIAGLCEIVDFDIVTQLINISAAGNLAIRELASTIRAVLGL